MYTNLLTGCFLLMFSLSSWAQEGVQFFQGNWQEAIQAAKSEQKLIFVDAFTDWCGPCKAMNRNTFPNAKVGAFFNAHFVNFKFDMEKGEGPGFANRYEVMAYPTLLFINHEGKLIHKEVGYKAPRELLAAARKATDPAKNTALLGLKYQSGNREPALLRQYALYLKEQKEDYRPVATQYFATQRSKDLLKQENWDAIQALSHDLQGPEYQYLLKKHKKFIKKYGYQPVLDKLYTVMKQATIQAAFARNDAKFQEITALAQKRIKDKGMMANRLRMTYAEATKNWDQYAAKAAYYFDTYQVTHPRELEHAAGLFARHLDQPQLLEQALAWTRQSIALENEAYNNETHARILLKLGRYDEAYGAARKAQQIANQQNQDTRPYDQLIRQIQAKRR